ncbi:metal-sulfur cluster assembly factor [Nitrosococcus watsonii]|uniref:MIP18 family-like domain-containing protein n=1 Tax=Nitrosococcus watsoni (strain C-113) TaxID=105559 RepID=D8K6I4_NITWC|nr:iron-sulfur cluster assembly protein [Nitrosococcus watsonii]ADJ28511.1 protein of unknown function DUF59 [Nitrosococcus watsonii C-113]
MSQSTLNQDKIIFALHEVIDPEAGVSIVDLGLIYHIQLYERRIDIRMTMTTPACPLHESIRAEIKAAIGRCLPEISEVSVELVWDPPWHPDRMSERAKRQLGWFGR